MLLDYYLDELEKRARRRRGFHDDVIDKKERRKQEADAMNARLPKALPFARLSHRPVAVPLSMPQTPIDQQIDAVTETLAEGVAPYTTPSGLPSGLGAVTGGYVPRMGVMATDYPLWCLGQYLRRATPNLFNRVKTESKEALKSVKSLF